MTGEMSRIDQKGHDSNGDDWPMHAAVAKALRCPLQPFDVYIGPYIRCHEGWLFLGSDGDGCEVYACLWPDGQAPAWRDPIVSDNFWHDDVEAAITAARDVLRRYRAERKRMKGAA